MNMFISSLCEIHHYIEQKNDILSKKSMKILKSF